MELMVAIAIFATIAAGVAVPIISSHLSSLGDRQAFQASTMLTESWEAVRSIRNRDWAELLEGDHGLSLVGGQWVMTGNSDIEDGITRVVTLATSERDTQGNLVDVGGANDPDTKKVTLSLSWQPPYSSLRTIVAESLLTNHKNPGAWPIPIPPVPIP